MTAAAFRLPGRIETARLVLRRFAAADLDLYIAIRAKPQVMRYLSGGEERARAAAEFAPKTLDTFAVNWGEHGFGPWAVEERATRTLIGHLGLRFLPERGETELIYMLDDAAWGRGYAREGAAAALAAADEAGIGELAGFTHPENVRSQKVLLASGFTPTGHLTIFGIDAVVFRRPGPQPA